MGGGGGGGGERDEGTTRAPTWVHSFNFLLVVFIFGREEERDMKGGKQYNKRMLSLDEEL